MYIIYVKKDLLFTNLIIFIITLFNENYVVCVTNVQYPLYTSLGKLRGIRFSSLGIQSHQYGLSKLRKWNEMK